MMSSQDQQHHSHSDEYDDDDEKTLPPPMDWDDAGWDDDVLPPPPPLDVGWDDDVMPPPPPPGSYSTAPVSLTFNDASNGGDTAAAIAEVLPLLTKSKSTPNHDPLTLRVVPPMEEIPTPPPTTTTQEYQDHNNPPPSAPFEPIDVDESIPISILNDMEPFERMAFLVEQRKLLEIIEMETSNQKSSSEVAWAMALEDRRHMSATPSSSFHTAAAAMAMASSATTTTAFDASGVNSTSTTSSTGAAQLQADAQLAETLHLVERLSKMEEQKFSDAKKKNKNTVLVKCLSCQNKLRVKSNVDRFKCPVCQVICRIHRKNNKWLRQQHKSGAIVLTT